VPSIVALWTLPSNGRLKSETVKYGREYQGTRTRERLPWQGPAAYTNDRPVLSSEKAPHKNQDRNCQNSIKYLAMSPRWGSTPRLTNWPSVAIWVWLWLTGDITRVEAGSNTSTVTLRVVGGDEKGSLKSETVIYGRESQGTHTREILRWLRGRSMYKRHTRPFVREGAPQSQDRNCQTVINIRSWAPDGAQHQNLLTDRQSQCGFDLRESSDGSEKNRTLVWDGCQSGSQSDWIEVVGWWVN
jgi:hypothetical protein